MQQLLQIAIVLSSRSWAPNKAVFQLKSWSGLNWNGIGALSRLVSPLSEPERLIVVGLSLILLSLIVRRRAARRASR